MASRFGETVVVQSTALGDETIITIRRQSVAGPASLMILVAFLPLIFGFIIASKEITLAVQYGLFVISPVSCIITGALVLIGHSRQDATVSVLQMNQLMIAGSVSALASCVAAIVFVCDLINYSGNWDVDDKVTVFSGFSFILSLFEMGLSLMVSTRCCLTNQNSANAFTVTHLSNAPTQITTQTPPTHQTPPTTQHPPPADLWLTPSALSSPPLPPVDPPPPYEKPPNYSSIVT